MCILVGCVSHVSQVAKPALECQIIVYPVMIIRNFMLANVILHALMGVLTMERIVPNALIYAKHVKVVNLIALAAIMDCFCIIINA